MDMMRLCDKHPEKEQIFCLVNMISEAGYPFFFNFLEDLRPTPFNQEGGDPEKDIDWDTYNFLIEVGQPVGRNLSQLSICFNHEGDNTLLELLDMRVASGKPDATAEDGELTTDMTAEEVMEVIEKFFDAM